MSTVHGMTVSDVDVLPVRVPVIEKVDDTDVAINQLDLATDTDASLRFAANYKDILRYCPGIGWLVWDKRRWEVDTDGRVIELSKQSARRWALKWVNRGEHDRARAALTLEGATHVKAAVDLARSDPRLLLRPGELDADPWSLNVLNGTLDLRTGTLRQHRREDLISKLAPVTFDPAATSDHLARFLAIYTPEMGAFLARCLGVTLTGNADVETLFLLQGDGGSGKTTLVEAVSALLGDYSAKLTFESFCLSKHGRAPGSASPDLITLRGSRLAYASEGDQSARLDAGVVKTLTGNEPITARALYKEPITFGQTWKLWLVSNFDPKADSEDSGIWRRMLKLQFTPIPKNERDPAVKRMLTTDSMTRSALLNWVLAGCLDWQARGGGREGLAPPDAVIRVTDAYRVKMDSLANWWNDLRKDAVLDSAGFTSVRRLREHYETWCRDEGATPVQAKRFAAYLEGKKLERGRGTGGIKGWRGIELEAT